MFSNTTEKNSEMIKGSGYTSSNEEKMNLIHYLAFLFDISREDSLSALLQSKWYVENACENLKIKLGTTGPAHKQNSEYLTKY